MSRKRNLIILVCTVVVWLAIDKLAKTAFKDVAPGTVTGGPYFGIFQFESVHNTGAAWGIFENGTFILGGFSLLVCILIILYIFVFAPSTPPVQTFGLSLVVAGGIGNAIDRFAYGYVIDFIDPVFIDFPVFNIADIGVTCGVVIFLVALIWDTLRGGRKTDA